MSKPKGIPKLLEEPLLHFLIIGAGLFLLFGWRGGGPTVRGTAAGAPAAQVVIARESVNQTVGQFEKTWQRPPTEEERRALVEDLVRNEIFYREAMAAGLDRDDEVLKRRLRQKMEFIYEDIGAIAEPTDADLAVFIEKHREKYITQPEVSFRQVYFNPDRRGKAAEADAQRALAQLFAGADPGALGDATMLEAEVTRGALNDIAKQFGDQFATSLLEAKPGRWTGPVRSGFGLHLVLVTDRREARMPDLGEIRDRVRQDWTAVRQKELKEAAYAKIRERYAVTVEKPAGEVAPPPVAASAGAAAR